MGYSYFFPTDFNPTDALMKTLCPYYAGVSQLEPTPAADITDANSKLQKLCLYRNDFENQQMQQIVTIMISTVFGMGNA